MNYRHIYHAGNFADVFKHVVIVALTQALLRKDTGFCFLDTHAGIGMYDLTDPAAKKSNEAEGGIRKIMAAENPPQLIQDYLGCVEEFNPYSNSIRYYPGSPQVVRQLLRSQDRMVLTELHAEDWQQLKNNFHHDRRTAVHHQDGYQALKAFLPPKERRGLILIDPPYEKPDELSTVSTALAHAITRFETGVYALWYPIKEKMALARFHKMLKTKISRPMLTAELCIYPENMGTQLNGCGVAIINPPFQIQAALKPSLQWLWSNLSPLKQGRYDLISL
jgi:23S rRNA (adenine2030-N6)-methyltransferase